MIFHLFLFWKMMWDPGRHLELHFSVCFHGTKLLHFSSRGFLRHPDYWCHLQETFAMFMCFCGGLCQNTRVFTKQNGMVRINSFQIFWPTSLQFYCLVSRVMCVKTDIMCQWKGVNFGVILLCNWFNGAFHVRTKNGICSFVNDVRM